MSGIAPVGWVPRVQNPRAAGQMRTRMITNIGVRGQQCLQANVVPTRMLGSGDFGSVWALEETDETKKEPKQWILKVSRLVDAEATESFEREVYFLKRLQGTGLVPELKSSAICGNEGMQLMERFDGSLQQLGDIQARQWGRFKGEKVLTQAQLDAVVSLVLKFDQHRIWHGDLKRANILYSIQSGQFRAVLADFGFSGAHDSPYYSLIGFARNYDCPHETIVDKHGYTKLRVPIPKSLRPFINRLEIYTDFIGGRRTFIVNKRGTQIFPINPKRLAHALKLPRAVIQSFRAFCPDAP